MAFVSIPHEHELCFSSVVPKLSIRSYELIILHQSLMWMPGICNREEQRHMNTSCKLCLPRTRSVLFPTAKHLDCYQENTKSSLYEECFINKPSVNE